VPIDGWSAGAGLSTTEALFASARCIAELSADQTGIGTGSTTIAFDQTIVDNLGAFDTSNNEYEIQRTGVYAISANLNTANLSANERITISLRQNGSQIDIAREGGSTTNHTADIFGFYLLNKGDLMSIQADSLSDASWNISSATSTFSIVEMPDFSVFSVFGQTEIIEAESADFNISTAGYASSEWAQMTGNSVTLGPGKWRLNATVELEDSTPGTGDLSQLVGKWASANGNNTTTEPASISGIQGAEFMRSQLNVNSLSRVAFAMPTVVVTLTSETTLYCVNRVSFGSAGSTTTKNHILAERIS
jgi:hypothetical protein